MNTTSSSTSESEGPAAWWQAFDESEATVACQYVWGARPGHRDELILRDRVTTLVTSETSSEPPELDERLWSLMDYYDPTSTVNTAGEVVERYRFSAFGLRAVLAPDFSTRTVSHYDWDFAFKGQFLDADTGYYNYGYRYYSPELGRWLSRDPLGEEANANLFCFVDNQPTNALDYLGLISIMVGKEFTDAECKTLCEKRCLQNRTKFKSHMLTWSSSSGAQFTPTGVICWTVRQQLCNCECIDPCKGLRRELHDHLLKLQMYQIDPLYGDDGRLRHAIDTGNKERAQNIFDGRVNELKKQIETFQKDLESCLKVNGL